MQLRLNGKRMQVAKKLEYWIGQNIDRFFYDPVMKKNLEKLRSKGERDGESGAVDELVPPGCDENVYKARFEQALRAHAFSILTRRRRR